MNNRSDIHTHSTHSFDGKSSLAEMVESARKKGLLFYGVSEHVDYEVYVRTGEAKERKIDEAAYFHDARHLQDDYAGVLNVLVGAEFGYDDNGLSLPMYLATYEKYRPDYVINSVHCVDGEDYYFCSSFALKKFERTKQDVYSQYLALVRASLDVEYPYDVVGHFGYLTRYAPYPDREMRVAEFQQQIDGILTEIIRRDKILEVNSKSKDEKEITVPSREILERYFELGGRQVSFGSDAHNVDDVGAHFAEVTAMLKEIGFTYYTVPCRGERIKVEM